jgi:chorismate mutase
MPQEESMTIRGIRGATTVSANTAGEILAATAELLRAIVAANSLAPEDVACVTFTVTPDLDAAFPARAARELGWQHVPLLDACEIPVPGSLPRCIRALLLWNTDTPQADIVQIYLRDAQTLRPDLNNGPQAKEMSQ